jgi:hypothetical protein
MVLAETRKGLCTFVPLAGVTSLPVECHLCRTPMNFTTFELRSYQSSDLNVTSLRQILYEVLTFIKCAFPQSFVNHTQQSCK